MNVATSDMTIIDMTINMTLTNTMATTDMTVTDMTINMTLTNMTENDYH